MKHRILLLLAALVFTLTGCQLAKPEAEIESTKDRLVGIYVTTEPLDLSGSGIAASSGDGLRFYAEQVSTIMAADNGETTERMDYEFPGTGAALYFTMEGEGDHRYTASHGDNAMQEVHHAFGDYDGREESNLSGTVAVAPGDEDRVLYFNPIYQQEDGQVYVIPESGFGFCIGEGNQCEGEVYGHELSETTAITVDGEETETGTTVKVTVTVMFAPESVTVIQFDKGGAALRKTTFQAGEAPDRIVLDTGTAYLIVETAKQAPDGSTVTTREILDSDTETLSAYYVREDGLCAAQSVGLIWPDEEGDTP